MLVGSKLHVDLRQQNDGDIPRYSSRETCNGEVVSRRDRLNPIGEVRRRVQSDVVHGHRAGSLHRIVVACNLFASLGRVKFFIEQRAARCRRNISGSPVVDE
jgi:hypothetical protein